MKKISIYSVLLSLFVTYGFVANAQVTVTANPGAATMAQRLVGNGVTISNAVYNGVASQAGTFVNTSSNPNLGLTGGVVLTTGQAASAGLARSTFASWAHGAAGDATLSNVIGSPYTYDASTLQFDVVPQGNKLRFRYVFSSEEYTGFVCSQYNDVFGFFISGPNPFGAAYSSTNIAILPGTSLPVSINSVNNGVSGNLSGINYGYCTSLSNGSLYRDNNPGAYIVYDGFTAVLNVNVDVVPCQTYSLKLAIADVFDDAYDSGVFIEENSITSNIATITNDLASTGFTTTYEGCVNTGVTFNFTAPYAGSTVFDYVVTGSAQNGVDYQPLSGQVIVAGGATSATINIIPIQDNIAEGQETVTISLYTACNTTPYATLTVPINDVPAVTASVADNTLCAGQVTQLSAGSVGQFSWSPGTGVSNVNIANPTLTGVSSGNYTVTNTIGSCTSNAQVHVDVSQLAVSSTPTNATCNVLGSIDVTASNGVPAYSYDWGGGITSEDRSGLSSGTYTVTVTDGFGCTKTSSATITQPAVVQISATTTPVSCFGGSNGTISVSLVNATAPVTYNWSDGSPSGANRTGLAAGTYGVTVTDGNGCIASGSYTVGSPSAIIANATASNALCSGSATGSISLSVSGGTPGYTYLWSNGLVTANIGNLLNATYTVTITDANGCTAVTSATVATSTPVSVTGTKVDVACFSGSTGSINITAAGGTPGYSYNWGGGITTEDRSGLTAGGYSVTVTDVNGCTGTFGATITQPNALTIGATHTDVLCNGGNTGSIDLTVGGGTPGYTYLWSNSATTQDLTGLAQGTYTVTATDANGCTTTTSVTIGQPTTLILSETHADVLCNGGNTGSIDITAAGGTVAYTFNWGGGITTEDRSGLSAGSYTVTATDANGCTATVSVTIAQPTTLTLSETHADVLCNGGNTGSIDITAAGGTAAYTFNWGGGIITEDRSGLSAGTYTVTATDANGCTASLSVTIAEPTVLTATETHTSISCNGGTADIDATVAGGTAPYTYSWTGGTTSSSEDLTGLSTGTYTLVATDANGCTATVSVTIAQPTTLTLSETHADVLCNGGNTGSIDITAAGGTAAYTFNWGGGIITEDRSGLSAGTYTVTATDANGCTASLSVTIAEPTVLTATETHTSISCNGGTADIDATVAGGTAPYTYSWTGGTTSSSEDLTGLSTGTYTLVATDANGCTATVSVTIAQPTTLTLSETHADVLCNGGNTGSIDITAAGGTAAYTFNWGGGITTEDRSGLSAGTYTVTATDANGCTASLSVTIAEPATINLSETHSDVLCSRGNSGSIDLTVSGGTAPYSYSWTGGATSEDLTGLAAGTYTVTATDGNGCTSSVSVTIGQPSVLILSETHADVLCNGGNTGSIDITAAGGTAAYTFNWGGGITTEDRSGLSAGTYTVTATDANGCTQSISVTIAEPTVLTATETHTSISCNGGTADIDATVAGGTAPYTYSWTGGTTSSSEDLTGLSTGTYTLVATDANGCTATVSVTIAQPTTLTLSETHADVLCNGGNTGSIDITAAGGTAAYTFNWGGGIITEDRSGLSAGTYTVTATDANGCTASLSVTIAEPTVLTATETHTSISCNGGTADIDATVAGGTAPYTYSWTGGTTSSSEDLTGLSTGTYTLVATDANGCTATVSVTIAQPTTLALSETHADVLCNGGNTGSIDITAAGGTAAYTFNWGGGIITEDRSGLSAGTYTVTATDANGCTASLSVTIAEPTVLTATETHTSISCNGGTADIDATVAGGTAPYTYSWTGGTTSSSEDLTGLSTGTYTLVATDANGCTATVSVTIAQPTTLTLSETHADVLCNGGNTGSIDITAAGGTAAYTFNWGGGITTEDRSGLSAGTYTVTATDANGCTASLSVTIAEPSALVLSTTLSNILCNGTKTGAIDLTVRGGTPGYTYDWGNSITTEDRSGLGAGTYTVTVTDANGCTSTTSATLVDPAVLALTETHTDVTCAANNNGSIDVTVLGGTNPITTVWADGPTTEDRTGLAKGSYSLLVTDANGCTATISVNITEPDPVTLSASTTDVLCNGGNNGAIDLTIAGGSTPYTISWTGGSSNEDLTGLTAGTYSVTVRDANGCSASASYTINENPVLNVTASSTNILCFGATTGTVNTTVTGGATPYTYSWNNNLPGNPGHTGLGAGTYAVTVTDANGCTAVSSVTITQPAAALTASATGTDVKCFNANDGTATATTTGGTGTVTFDWGAQKTATITGLAAGTYTVTATDANGCTATASVTISAPAAALQASNTVNSTPTCVVLNGSATASATGGTAPYTIVWSGQAPGATLTAPAGTYTATITDANGCTATTSVTFNQPTPVTLSETHVDVSCTAATGSIDVTVSGGTNPITTIWTHGPQTEDLSGLAVGSYTLNVSDANGCTATITVAIQSVAATVTVTGTTTDVNCNNGNNGAINVSVSGATAPVTYAWGDNGVTTEDRSNLVAGTYSVTATDANGCTSSASFTLANPTALTATASKTDVTCSGTLGSIDVTATGGTGTTTYNWGGGIVSEDRTGLSAGTYTVTVTDSKGCTATASATIAQPSTVSIVGSVTDVNCKGGTDGSATVSVVGGSGTSTITWNTNPVQAGVTATNLAAGTYNVLVEDANGCSASATVTVSEPATGIQAFSSPTPNICYGIADGTAQLTANSGTPPYNFTIELVNSSNPLNRVDGAFTELAAGTYNLSVTDSKGCSAKSSFIVPGAKEDKFNVTSTPTSCFDEGLTDGKIELSALTPDNAPYEYAINSGTYQASSTFDSLTYGTYIISTKNDNGCVVNQQIEVVRPAQIQVSFPTDTLYKLMEETKELTPTVVSSGNVTYSWTSSSKPDYLNCDECAVNSTSTLHNINYSVTVRDANNSACFRTADIAVIVRTEIRVPNVFTPNNDGNNDVFYPIFNNVDTKITDFRVFNRWGQVIHNIVTEGWNGTFDSKDQPNGTFLYFVAYERLNTNDGTTEKLTKQGEFTLIR